MTTGKSGAARRDKTFAKAKLELEAARRGEALPPIKKQAKPRHIEDDHQAAYFRWVDLMAATDPRYLNIYAVPNGGNRNAFEAARLVKQGTRKGYPDINVDVVISGHFSPKPGLRIEMKRPIVRGQQRPIVSPEQKDWFVRLQQQGYVCCLCYGWDAAQEATAVYMAGKDAPHQWEQNA